jgi:hypothetical protein
MRIVHLRINDADSGESVPVRLRITNEEGQIFPPLGRAAEFPAAGEIPVGCHLRVREAIWYAIDGNCEVPLPTGVPLRIQATRGPEYACLDQRVTLGTGQLSLRMSVSRQFQPRQRGWIAGDGRVHGRSAHDAALEAAAEGLDLLNLQAAVTDIRSEHDGRIYSLPIGLAAFSGQQPALCWKGVMVIVNTLNRHPVLGSLSLLNCHRPVFPLVFGGPDDTDDWSLSDWCAQCHRKGGLVVWADPFSGTGPAFGGEALIATLLGQVDAVEWSGSTKTQPLLPWCYRLWNLGFCQPLLGVSGDHRQARPPGYPRTYARVRDASAWTYRDWIEAIRQGECYTTNGPLLDWEWISDTDSLHHQPESSGFGLRAWADSVLPITTLELLHQGKVVASAPAVSSQANRWSARIEWRFSSESAGWWAVRCSGPAGSPWHDQPLFAHSAPLVPTGQRGGNVLSDSMLAPLRQAVEATADWLATVARFRDVRNREQHLQRCQAVLERLAHWQAVPGQFREK